MITPEQRTEIRRLFYAEHHTINAIAASLGVHRETVARAIDKEAFVTRSAVVRRRGIDTYLPLVREIYERIPMVRATRLLQMLEDRGFKGKVGQVRRALRELRSQRRREAYLRLSAFPGDQAQCDWAHFGTLAVERAVRKLSLFVMVLSYSRQIYAVFTFDQTLESFLRGHVLAFAAFGGVPRTILYDNLKACVIERYGKAIRFNPAIVELSSHYHFRAEPCNVARGNEKGRVERAIGYVRTSFFPGRTFRDLADANRQLSTWLETVANVRPWPQAKERSVADAYQEDKAKLLPLPEHPADCWHVKSCRSDKTSFVRFDLNDYSVPPEYCQRLLTLMASDAEVRFLDGQKEIIRHPRSYGRGERIEAADHASAILAQKKAALPARRREALVALIPRSGEMLELLVQSGEALHGHLRRLYALIDHYGAQAVAKAIDEALARGTPRAESVAHILQRKEQARKAPPVLPLRLPERPGVRDLTVKSHDLTQYDDLGTDRHNKKRDPL
jgi:transposase